MSTEIKMPQLGETVVEGTITKWLKKEGDKVEADELLVEVSTDKVDSEVPSSAAGVIEKILVPEGETVKVGTALALIGEGGAGGGDADGGEQEDDSQQEASKQEGASETQQSAEEATDKPLDAQGEAAPEPGEEPESGQPAARGEGDGGKEEQKGDDGDRAASNGQQQQEKAPPPPPGPTGKPGDQSKRGIISPLVRKLADENSVDLNEIEGTGTGGRIRKQDVLRFVEERKRTPGPAPAAASAGGGAEAAPAAEPQEERAQPVGGREELVPWTNIRRRTAEHMVASSREVARAWNAVEADWTNVAKLRASAKESFKEREGFSLTYMPFLCKAVCDTLMEMPEVNATFDEENQANLVKHYVNLGIAVALEGGGLIVPVIKGADEKNLVGLARSVNELATKARTKKLTPDDLTQGTFTITNPGPFGSVISVPIIPRGQTGILGFEAVRKAVVATEDDQIAIRSMGFLTMSWDHRTIDGAEAARFLAALKERIEQTDFTADLAPYL